MTAKKHHVEREAPTKTELIDKHVQRALEKIETVLEGDQRMAGAEGPAQSHPGALDAIAPADNRCDFLRALLEPLVRTALTSFSRELAREKLEAEPLPEDVDAATTTIEQTPG